MPNILIIGGGAAGVATALSIISLQPNGNIELCERNDRLGGMAHSRTLPNGEEYNYGVQGVHESFVYSLQMIALAQKINKLIPDPKPASLSAQFMQSTGQYWNTAGGGSRAFSANEISLFKELCTEASWAEDVYSLLDITEACEDNNIESTLVQQAILPTLALFFGTGQKQGAVPASIASQVFGSEKSTVQIFDLDYKNFITPRANMKALPPLGPVYTALLKLLRKYGVKVTLNCNELPDFSNYDKVIICTQAEDAVRLLPVGHKAIKVLQKAEYYNDVTVTHTDSNYMTRMFGDSGNFNYYMRDTSMMGFSVHKYQQLRTPLYQCIYLNTHDVPDDIKPIAIDPWRQFACTVQHLEECALKLHTVQGPHIYFAGSYALVNSHEIAIMSGIRAAQLACGTNSFPEDIWGLQNAAYEQFKNL